MPFIEQKSTPQLKPKSNFFDLRKIFSKISIKTIKEAMQSSDFVTGVSGWQLKAEGDFEANDGVFRGTLSGNTINIPNSTDPKFSVDSTGVMKAKSYSLIAQYVAGQNIPDNSIVCLRHKPCAWGDDAGADRDTDASILTALTCINQRAPDTNYNAADTVYLGRDFNYGSGSTCWNYILGKIDFTSNPPGLPSWAQVDKVFLRIYVVFPCTANHPHTVTLSRITADWDASTVTWNTAPTDDGANWGAPTTGTAFLTETMASVATLVDDGYIEFDITDLYRLWQHGGVANYGFIIKADESSNFESVVPARLGGINRNGGGNFNQRVYLKIIPTVDDPGSGNIITVNDGKIYLSSNSNYNLVKNIVGFVKDGVSSGETADVYALADRSIIPITANVMKIYYLFDTVGRINYFTNDIIFHDKWSIRIGIGTSAGLVVDYGKDPVFIKSTVYPGIGIFPPPHARMAIVANGTTSQCVLYKDRVQSSPLASWATGTAGKLTSTTGYVIYWYK